MRKQPLINLLNKIGTVPERADSNWVNMSCPLAFKTHISGRDNTPSCGISINNEKQSQCHCFTCGTRPLSEVIHILTWTKGVKEDVHRYFLEHEILNKDDDKLEYKDKFSIEQEEPKSVPPEILDLFEPIENISGYLTYRGISLYYSNAYGLLYCREVVTAKGKKWINAIVYPIRDIDKQVYWLHFRSLDSKAFWHAKPEHLGYEKEWGRADSWFGIEFLDITKPVVLVEGIMDCLRLRTLGLDNVIASHGSISKKSKKLARIANLNPKLVYLGFDSDQAGAKMKEVARRTLQCETINLDWSKVGCKDPGELKTKQDLQIVLDKKMPNFKFADKYGVKAHELV